MLPTTTLRDRLRDGPVVLGLSNTYPAAGIIEGMCRGWDLVWIDGQHGQFGYTETIHAVRTAAASGLYSLLRVAGHEPGVLGPAADMAPSAVMVPMVNTANEARAIARALQFPPVGERSYGGRRVSDVHTRDYPTLSDLVVVAQIETPEAMENAAQIIAVEGIDMLLFGPDDMKLRLGLPLDTSAFENPQMREMMSQMAATARAAGKFAAGIAMKPADARACLDWGYRVIIGGADIAFLRAAAPQRLAEIREALQ